MASGHSSSPTVGQHLFTPVSHPVLRRYGRKQIHTFVREREQYLLKIQEVNDSGGKISAISIKASIDPDLLLSLVEIGEFPGVSKAEALSEDTLKD